MSCRRRRALGLAGVGVLSAWFAGASPSVAAPEAAVPPPAGLAQAWTGAQGSWAVVPMGHIGHPENTFWQVLFRPAGTGRWTLVTPPGIATNGGISVGGVPGAGATMTVGIQPTTLLTYSPLARTSDGGKKWSPGVLASGLADVADALASGAGGTAYALVRRDHGTLLHSSGSLTAWSEVVTESQLARTAAGRACGISALEGVADVRGVPVLAAACSRPGVVGIFEDAAGAWRLAGPPRGGATSTNARVEVLRITSGPAGTFCLLEEHGAAGTSLVALWRSSPAQPWSASRAVRVRDQVLATDEEEGQAVAVVTGRNRRATGVLVTAGPGSAWRSLARPPRGTQAVVGATHSVVALASAGSTMEVWRLGTRGWTRTERFEVPIAYGSST